MLGERLKALRELKGYVQRQVAAALEVDTAYISKIESDEKLVSRNHLKTLSNLYKVSEDELLTLWLADKLYDLAKNEKVAIDAIEIATTALLKNRQSKNKRAL